MNPASSIWAHLVANRAAGPNEVRKSVKLTRLFYISQKEVSNREFRKFKPRHTSGAEKYRELAADDNPAVMMSWDEAASYCNWLSDQDGLARAYVIEAGELVLADPPHRRLSSAH